MRTSGTAAWAAQGELHPLAHSHTPTCSRTQACTYTHRPTHAHSHTLAHTHAHDALDCTFSHSRLRTHIALPTGSETGSREVCSPPSLGPARQAGALGAVFGRRGSQWSEIPLDSGHPPCLRSPLGTQQEGHPGPQEGISALVREQARALGGWDGLRFLTFRPRRVESGFL